MKIKIKIAEDKLGELYAIASEERKTVPAIIRQVVGSFIGRSSPLVTRSVGRLLKEGRHVGISENRALVSVNIDAYAVERLREHADMYGIPASHIAAEIMYRYVETYKKMKPGVLMGSDRKEVR